ncbi:MAG: hypothetical protein ACE5KV_04750 [Thermoplasmata archaeon]
MREWVEKLAGEKLNDMNLNVSQSDKWIASREVNDCVDYENPRSMLECFAREIRKFNRDVLHILRQRR